MRIGSKGADSLGTTGIRKDLFGWARGVGILILNLVKPLRTGTNHNPADPLPAFPFLPSRCPNVRVRIRYPGIYRSQFLDLISSFQDIVLDAHARI